MLDDVWYFEFRYLTNNKIQACIFNVKERYKSYLSPKNIRIPFYKEFDRKYVPWKVLRREGLKIINSPEFKRMILARKMK